MFITLTDMLSTNNRASSAADRESASANRARLAALAQAKLLALVKKLELAENDPIELNYNSQHILTNADNNAVFIGFAQSLKDIVASTTGLEDWAQTQYVFAHAITQLDNILNVKINHDVTHVLALRNNFITQYLNAINSLETIFPNVDDKALHFFRQGELLKLVIVRITSVDNEDQHLSMLNENMTKFISLYQELPEAVFDDGGPLNLITSMLLDVITVLCKTVASKMLPNDLYLSMFMTYANCLRHVVEASDKDLADSYGNKIHIIQFLYEMQQSSDRFEELLAKIQTLKTSKFLTTMSQLESNDANAKDTATSISRTMIIDVLQNKIQKNKLPNDWDGVKDFYNDVEQIQALRI